MEAKGAKRVPAVKKALLMRVDCKRPGRITGRQDALQKGAPESLGSMEGEAAPQGEGEPRGRRAVKGMLAKRKERKRGWDPGAVGPRTMAEK